MCLRTGENAIHPEVSNCKFYVEREPSRCSPSGENVLGSDSPGVQNEDKIWLLNAVVLTTKYSI